MDDLLARLTRASATLDDLALASSLESALVRAGRLEEAYLLRWRRGEPSPVAAELAARQRPVLEALASDPGLLQAPCAVCGDPECGHDGRLEVATGPDPDGVERTLLGPDEPLPAAPVVGARRVARPCDLEALVGLGTIVELRLADAALQGDARLPLTTTELEVVLDRAEETSGLRPEHVAALPDLRRLALSGRVTDEALDDLLRACGAELAALRLRAERLTEVGLEALRWAPRLRELDLRSAPWFDGSCLGALVDAGAPLERFSLCRAPRSTWRTCAALGELSTLRSIDLDDVDLDDGASDLAALPALRRLSHGGGAVAPSSLGGLAETPVEELTLRDVAGVEDEALEALAGSPTLRSITLSRLGALTTRAWSALAGAAALSRLELASCPIDTDGLVAIARSPSITDLGLEDLAHVQPGQAFEALGRMPRLQRLSLAGDMAASTSLEALATARSGLTDVELRPLPAWIRREHLAAAARLPALECLTVNGYLAPGSLPALAGAPALRTLRLTWTVASVDEAEVDALRACFWLERLEVCCDEATRLRLQDALPEVEVRSPWDA